MDKIIKWQKKNLPCQKGYTLIEILIGSALSLLLISLAANLLTGQRQSFTRQNSMAEMQSNGRAATDLIARSIMNSGYNVTRGRRILTASDRYIATVFDEDANGTIENDEVFVYAISEATGTTTESLPLIPISMKIQTVTLKTVRHAHIQLT